MSTFLRIGLFVAITLPSTLAIGENIIDGQSTGDAENFELACEAKPKDQIQQKVIIEDAGKGLFLFSFDKDSDNNALNTTQLSLLRDALVNDGTIEESEYLSGISLMGQYSSCHQRTSGDFRCSNLNGPENQFDTHLRVSVAGTNPRTLVLDLVAKHISLVIIPLKDTVFGQVGLGNIHYNGTKLESTVNGYPVTSISMKLNILKSRCKKLQ